MILNNDNIKRLYRTAILSLAALMAAASFSAVQASNPRQKVFLIPVSGTVEPGMAAFIKRTLKEIQDDENTIYLFKMDTFGGRVDAALDIVDTISSIEKGKTIAFVEKRAISAGALIALSSSQLFMKPNTIIGDCAPIIQTQEGQKMAGEKVQTVLRAKFRALAKKNNYPVKLAESMVTIDMEIYQIAMADKTLFVDQKGYENLTDNQKKNITSKKTLVAKGELLTMDDKEAVALNFSQKSVKDVDELLSLAGYKNIDVTTIEPSWSVNFVRFLQPFLPMMMLMGIGLIYTEMKAPGFGFPGIAGILLLSLVFFNQYLAGLADYTELLLLLIGFLLLGIEVFVLPGFGVAGISGLIVIACGLVLAFQDFVMPNPEFPWETDLLMKNLALVSGSFVAALALSFFTIRFILPKVSKIWEGPYLETDLTQARVDTAGGLDVKPGNIGTAHTYLRPSGKIVVHNKKIDAITQGEFIEQGQEVIIDKIDQNRVIVKKT